MSSNLERFKFKVGQLVLATKEAAYINQGPTYIVVQVVPGFYSPTDPVNERPYRIRQLNGEPIPLSRGVKLDFYSSKTSWARECQIQALPEDEEEESSSTRVQDEQDERDVVTGRLQDEQAEAYRRLSELAARQRLNDEPVR